MRPLYLFSVMLFCVVAWADDECPFAKLSAQRRAVIEKFGSSTRDIRIELFANASASEQKDFMDTVAAQRLANIGTFTETVALDLMYHLAVHPKASRESTRQALQHFIHVFHSQSDPVWYGDFKIEQEKTGSGFGSSQSNMEYSRKLAIDYATQLAANGMGGEYEYSLLLNGLKEALNGSEHRPAGRGMEVEAVHAGLRLISAADSQFPDHLKPAAARLLPENNPQAQGR